MRGSFHLLHLLGARIKFKNVAGMPMALEVGSRTLSSAVGGLACIIFPWVRETVAPSSATPVFIINNSALYLQKGITDARWLCHCCMTHMRSGGDAQEYARLQVHDFDMQKHMLATLLM